MTDILIIDGDAFTRSGLCLYLESLGYQVREAGDVRMAWEMVLLSPPTLAVIAIVLPLQSNGRSSSPPSKPHGLELTRKLKKSFPMIGIVLLSADQSYDKEGFDLVQQYTRSVAYLHKGGDMSQLEVALKEVQADRTLFPINEANKHVLATAVSTHFTPVETPWIEQALNEFGHLSPREQEVTHLLAASYTSEFIAARLGLSKGSVDNVVSRIYNRLGLANMRTENTGLRPLPILIKACLLYDIRQSK